MTVGCVVMVKMCVVRLSSLGDTVLVTPVLRELRSRFPESHITVLVKDEYAPVFENNPNVDHLFRVDVRGEHRGLWGLKRLVDELRRQEFDLFFDLHRNLRAWFITAGARAKRTFVYDKRRLHRLAMVYAKWLPVVSRHTVDLYFECVAPLGIDPAHRRPEVFLRDEEVVEAQLHLKKRGIDAESGPVGIHIGARGNAKRWSPIRFAHVADALAGRGLDAVIFCSDGDEPFVEEMCRAMRYTPTLVQRPPLRRLMALIDRCSVLLCHDSGPMHLAVARGVPVVALFGPTHPKLGFWPLGERDLVLTAEKQCSPCSLHGTKACRRKVRECMEMISEDRVLEALVHSVCHRGDTAHVGS